MIRSSALAGVGVLIVVGLLFVAYTSGFGHPTPRHIPVAVVAPASTLSKLASSPALAVRHAATPVAAQQMALDRDAYGAFVFSGPKQLTLLAANGAGHSVEAALTTIGSQIAKSQHARFTVHELAPTSRQDPNGTVEFYAIVFLTIGAALIGTLLSRMLGVLSGLVALAQRLAVLTVISAAAAGMVTLFADPVFGALVGHSGWLFLALWSYTLSIALAASGAAAILGAPGGIGIALTLTILGNPSAGGAVGRPLLNPFFSALNPILPQGGGISIVRGLEYFGGRGITAGVVCLAIWAVGGLLLMSAGTYRQIRARRPRAIEPPSPKKADEPLEVMRKPIAHINHA